MPRRAVVLVALLASTRAPADPCVTPPKHPALRAMAVELRDTAASGDEAWKLDVLAAAAACRVSARP